jgi:hypothetical protein
MFAAGDRGVLALESGGGARGAAGRLTILPDAVLSTSAVARDHAYGFAVATPRVNLKNRSCTYRGGSHGQA